MKSAGFIFQRPWLALAGASVLLLSSASALAAPPPPRAPHRYVRPAVGAYVSDVPRGYTEQTIGPHTYRIYDGLYYLWDARRSLYQVLDRPLPPRHHHHHAPLPLPPPPPPPRPAVGSYVKDVPRGYTEQTIGPHTYRIYDGLYYLWDARRSLYQVLDRPLPPPPPPPRPAVGSYVKDVPRGYTEQTIGPHTYRIYDGLYYLWDARRSLYQVLERPLPPPPPPPPPARRIPPPPRRVVH